MSDFIKTVKAEHARVTAQIADLEKKQRRLECVMELYEGLPQQKAARVEERAAQAPELVQAVTAAEPVLLPPVDDLPESPSIVVHPADVAEVVGFLPGGPVERLSSVALLPPILNEKSNIKNDAQPIDASSTLPVESPESSPVELPAEPVPAAANGQIPRVQAVTSQDSGPQKPPIDLVDAAKLEAVTEKMSKVFKTVVAITARNERAGMRNTAIESLYGNVQDSLEALTKRRYLVRAGEYGGMYWVPLAQGEPRITRQWESRTAGAAARRAGEPEPEEPIAAADLSPRQQVLLHVIITEGAQQVIHATKHNIETERVPDLLKRLETHGCIAITDGSWQATARGLGVHAEITSAGLPVLAPLPSKGGKEVKISMPVVRRVNGDGKEIKPAEAAKGYTLFDMETYLRHKHHTVTKLTGGEFIIDGNRCSKTDTLAMVNQHRLKSELQPMMMSQVK